MKNLIFTIFTVIAFSSLGQILRKDVYRFDTGDRFCVRYYYGYSFQTTVTARYDLFFITDVNYNSDSSFVSYNANVNTYIPPLGPGQTGQFSTSSTSFSHNNLNALYDPLDQDDPFGVDKQIYYLDEPDTTGCQINFTDTSSTNCNGVSRNRFEFGMTFTTFPPCFEPVTSSYFVQEGCGGPYGSYQNIGDPSAPFGGTDLMYFRKGDEECGQHPAELTLGISEPASLVVGISPNPATEILNLEILPGNYTYKIVSILGSILNSGTLEAGQTSISVNVLSPGTYILDLSGDKGSGRTRFIKQ